MKTSDSNDALLGSPTRAAAVSFCIYSLWSVVVIVALWGFTADDSFIVYRYAANVGSGNGLTYNLGETISAITSPLHAILCSLLTLLPFPLLISNKLLAIILLVASLAWASYRLHHGPFRALLVMGLLVSSPLVLFWSVGGLETPYLLALLALVYCNFDRYRQNPSLRSGLLLSIACGFCFLARFDSVLLFGPVLIHSAFCLYREHGFSVRGFVALFSPVTLVAGSWLLFSLVYFHDIFPTSYYSKGVAYSWYGVAANTIYILQFLAISGLPVVLFVFFIVLRLHPDPPQGNLFFRWSRRHAGFLVGLLLSGLYAAGMVTTHMMFSYRFLIPFLPVLLFLALDLFRHMPTPSGPAPGAAFAATTLSVLLLQGVLLTALLTTSLNIGVIGEYRSVNVGQYSEFTELLAEQSACIREHWAQQEDRSGIPVVYVYAAGIPGYRLPDYRIVDSSIISYRHYFRGRGSGVSRSAHYLFVTTRHGPVDRQLGGFLTTLERLPAADRAILFDGELEEFTVYYNPTPGDRRLPAYIDGPAPSPSTGGISTQ